ncbi:DNA mismatch repair protein MutL [Orientia tsutsugamushi]|uniref:DNA mismatch repair protein MutL n=1 Tax=Orientia tsutsugamushi str. TA716 TaxID=1359175 RepID=A0A0F3P9E9_ORITS|nr:DNA mismatch repair endonuclease MutL [Orientia tsutsugamushi]KJV75416.1 DNA mismatch repair MutL family protein [Orientia tsutsugamushi str. TA763]KJV76970.1 DNA mismatch repair MutL family protein [Orientia tsutsugamushi str. TA716]SPP24916.1 DNA mismatch repair protein MutL [Orientia tsutsugamushi]
MGVIKYLSDTTINRIAAGEVVERPASVVKELVENSIDSGAMKVDITLEKSGKNLIIVSDNGCGMSAEDLETAIERHTTSKLNENDIMNINTFGFRGEALPSIASVSRMRIVTKSKLHDQAYEINVHGGVKTKINSLPQLQLTGTKIEVRDLFFATPARLKFLRSDRTEYIVCYDVVKRLAISYPHIAFSLVHDDKTILKLKASSQLSFDDARKSRISEILSKNFIDNAISIGIERDELSITGFVSVPTYNKASAEDQLLFVNNRPVKDKLLMTAIRLAYQGVLARERYPVVVIFISVAPHFVDVNVHPTKSEVRFHDSSLVRGIIISAIKQALLNTSQLVSSIAASDANKYMKPQYDTGISEKLELSKDIKNIQQFPLQELVNNFSKDFNVNLKSEFQDIQTNNLVSDNEQQKIESTTENIKSFSAFNQLVGNTESNQHMSILDDDKTKDDIIARNIASNEKVDVNKQESIQKLNDSFCNNFGDSYQLPLGLACAQFHGNYILAQTVDSLIIVDQHAAHERITYENLRSQFQAGQIIRQRLLMPQVVILPDIVRVEKLCDKMQEILALGMGFERCGDVQVKVFEMPAILQSVDIEAVVNDVADYLLTTDDHILLADMVEKILQSYSCYHSIRSGRILTIAEMNSLLRQIETTPFSGQCNHGRPTYVRFELKDIEKLFGRR